MKRRDGFVLLAALWIVVFSVAVSAELARRFRSDRLIAANLIEEVIARNAAQSGIERARAVLTARLIAAENGTQDTELLRDPWAGVAEQHADALHRIGEATYTVRVIPAGALLNANRLTAAEWSRFFHALGVQHAQADSIAQAIADWIDIDDAAHPMGAERNHYNTPPFPTNAELRDVHELRSVRGVTPGIFEAASSHLTVTGSGVVHTGVAPAPVLAALPGMTPNAVTALMRRRSEGPLLTVGDIVADLSGPARRSLEIELPRLAARTTTTSSEVLAISEGAVEGGARVVIEALFVRSGGRAHTASWRIR